MQDHSLMIVETRYRRILVKSSADAVSVEIADHTETVTTRAGLNRLADIAKSVARLSREHRISLSVSSCVQEALRYRRNNSNGSTHPSIGKISIEFNRNVDVDQIALAQMARERWNAMSGLVIDADTRGSGKVVGHSRCRSRTVSAEDFASDRVEFPCCDARRDGRNHRVSSFGNDSRRSS